ncbi:MAG: hypothetical protein GWN87_19395 [Desulfuromonadales bacterium]|nr:hypothetical protein [Desulfuromonadales bacterium]NIS42204.1 hypothetical protein [Desulfuromonadales bacterium]
MTEQQFRKLCNETEIGTSVSFSYRDRTVRGKFIGCAEDAVIIETDGKATFWPWELCDYHKSSYPTPTYS